ncbi:MAG: 2-C-methyl-D-erythritol 2,4-cyclodiphosphate synthase [Firmicutes bacterium]|nr:2-C-methyl-D-erythritol 2,4-cyclodiphosphate synthase [Bacillota bacterium]
MIAAVIPAAGQGKRMGDLSVPSKQLLELEGVPAVIRTLKAFEATPEVDAIALVVPPQLCDEFTDLVQAHGCEKVRWVVPGGKGRQESVYRGLQALPETCEYVIIHDGGRPLVTRQIIEACLKEAKTAQAVCAAVPVKDTIKVSQDGRVVDETPHRSTLWQIQTPQVFSYPLILELHRQAQGDGVQVTDDAALAERYGYPVYLAPGAYTNIKLTTAEDLAIAEALLTRPPYRQQDEGESDAACGSRVRSGFGYDVHRLVPGRPLILGGVEVPYHLGLEGHSDADVAVHALMDSILGAAALGDIGRHFPDSDPAYKGASSIQLLRQVLTLIGERGWRVGNIDVTIAAQRPKLAPYIDEMRSIIAANCQVAGDAVNVKATTTEGLGFVGQGEGIAAYASCTLVKA